MALTMGGGGGGTGLTEEELAALGQLGSLTGGGAAAEEESAPTIYMGTVIEKVQVDPTLGYGGLFGNQNLSPSLPRTETNRSDRWLTPEDALVEFNNWNDKTRADFIAQAKVAGLIDPEGGLIEGARLWRMLVEEAQYYGMNDQKVSPWDILTSYVKSSGGEDAVWQADPSNPDFEVNRLTGERRYTGPEFRTTSETRVDFSDPGTARAIATSVFQQMMGRDPGAGELERFANALHEAEQSNPVVATTTTQYDPVTGEAIGSDTSTEGGMSDAARELLATDQVKGKKEYARYQASTTYANALESAVWSAPGLGGA
jgi:hypothetical protein